ncbi:MULTISPECIES: sensor histidine kinase [unclassified Microcoleus]|uniref:sensor histidine kinase n=1 Tax=unclassified Microcoleus TaxID=2642155 RepID=UPI002FD4AB00
MLASQTMARSEIELEHLYSTAPIGLCLLDPDLKFLRINERLAEMNGLPVDFHIGKTVDEILPDLAPQAHQMLRHFLNDGGQVSKLFSGTTPAQPEVVRQWIEHWTAIRNDEGDLTGLSVVVEEVTERKKQEKKNILLLNELQHRLQNNLAVVRAIARATLSKVDGASEVLKDFENRISALAAAHLLLRSSDWERSDVRDLVSAVLATTGADRFEIAGTSVNLSSNETMALAMVLHELGTNACKYGSLSCEGGKVSIAWEAKDHVLHLSWRESGGPLVKPPQTRGFGSKMIQDLVGASGQCDLSFSTKGVECEIQLVLANSKPNNDTSTS